MEREIVIDTETTGLEATSGDRIVEIAAIELLNGIPSQNVFHTYINPERDIPDSAYRVHGISYEMVADKPKFCDIAEQFLAFISGDPIVAHNAEFDLGFINAELRRLGRPELGGHPVVDTLAMARKKFPAQSNSLDALCNRFGVDRSRRVKHGALVDAEILAEVYTELRGGRQTTLTLQIRREVASSGMDWSLLRERSANLRPTLAEAERAAHNLLVHGLGAPALWELYTEKSEA